MAGQYKRIKPDGAKWRCRECDDLFDASGVIYFIPVGDDSLSPRTICTGCIDPDWFSNAECVGSI